MSDLVVIYSGERDAYWRPKAAGYDNLFGAGVYTREEAERLTRSCGPEKMVQIRSLEEVKKWIEVRPGTVLELFVPQGEIIQGYAALASDFEEERMRWAFNEGEPAPTSSHLGWRRSLLVLGATSLPANNQSGGG